MIFPGDIYKNYREQRPTGSADAASKMYEMIDEGLMKIMGKHLQSITEREELKRDSHLAGGELHCRHSIMEMHAMKTGRSAATRKIDDFSGTERLNHGAFGEN